jgi:hypothetical protein
VAGLNCKSAPVVMVNVTGIDSDVFPALVEVTLIVPV